MINREINKFKQQNNCFKCNETLSDVLIHWFRISVLQICDLFSPSFHKGMNFEKSLLALKRESMYSQNFKFLISVVLAVR